MTKVELQLELLLKRLGVQCIFYDSFNQPCRAADFIQLPDKEDLQTHFAGNCCGDICECDLPEKFHDIMRRTVL